MTDRTIWKFALGEHEVPVGYKVVHAGRDPSGIAHIWLSVPEGIHPTVRIETKLMDSGIWFSSDWKPVGVYIDSHFFWHILIREIPNTAKEPS